MTTEPNPLDQIMDDIASLKGKIDGLEITNDALIHSLDPEGHIDVRVFRDLVLAALVKTKAEIDQSEAQLVANQAELAAVRDD
jgi:hypothetical protein